MAVFIIMVTVYGLKNCSTCKKATKWLTEHGVEHTFIDYRDNPISPKLLLQWAPQVGGWTKLVNRASPTWRNLPDQSKTPESDQDWLQLIADFPTLVRRPVTVDTTTVSVGFKPDAFAQRFA